MKWLPVIAAILFSGLMKTSEAQAQESSHQPEVQAFFAPLVSYTTGVDDTIPMGGLRLSTVIGKGYIEYTLATGAGHGVTYQIMAVDFRLGTDFMGFNVFGTLGLNFDYYHMKPSSGSNESQFGNGFHFAGGFTIPLAPQVTMRADFQERFGPGRSLWVMLGPAVEF